MVIVICISVVVVGVLAYFLWRTRKRLEREIRVNKTMNDGIYQLLKATGNSMRMLDDERYELITRVKLIEKELQDMEKPEEKEFQTDEPEEKDTHDIVITVGGCNISIVPPNAEEEKLKTSGIHDLHRLRQIHKELQDLERKCEAVSYNASSELVHILKVVKELKERSEKQRQQRKKQRAKEKKKEQPEEEA